MFVRFGRAFAASSLATAVALAAGVAPATAHVRNRTVRAADSRNPIGPLVPARPTERLPLRGGTVYSLNWSGYAVTPSVHDVTAVSSTFVVPAAGLLPPGFAAMWAGIGGYSTSDLLQAGTAEQSAPSDPLLGPQYYAWYELLPNAETQLSGCSGDPSCAVSPGDQISVAITEVSGSKWKLAMSDAGRWTWSKEVSYSSSRSSAEWILEAPTLIALQTLLAPVGTVRFGPTSTYTASGVTRTIAQGDPTKIILSPSPVGGLDEATPSALAADGQSFNACAYASSCSAP
jgi:hypothetical protein